MNRILISRTRSSIITCPHTRTHRQRSQLRHSHSVRRFSYPIYIFILFNYSRERMLSLGITMENCLLFKRRKVHEKREKISTCFSFNVYPPIIFYLFFLIKLFLFLSLSRNNHKFFSILGKTMCKYILFILMASCMYQCIEIYHMPPSAPPPSALGPSAESSLIEVTVGELYHWKSRQGYEWFCLIQSLILSFIIVDQYGYNILEMSSFDMQLM